MIKVLPSRERVLTDIALLLVQIDNFAGRSGEVAQIIAPYCNTDNIVTYRLKDDQFEVVYSGKVLSGAQGEPYPAAMICEEAYAKLLEGNIMTCVELAELDFTLPCMVDDRILSSIVYPVIVEHKVVAFAVFISYTWESWTEDTVVWISTVMAMLTGSMRRSRSNELLAAELAWRDKIYPIIAHDLRSDMGSITMMFDAMRHAKDDKERDYLLDMMRVNATQAFLLLDNLLKWSRSELHHDMTPNFEVVNFIEQVRLVVLYFETLAKIKGVALRTDFPLVDFTTRVDVEMIMTSVRNLLSNAIKFTPSGGSVVVGVRLSEASIEVWVRDDGVGVSPENIERINNGDLASRSIGTQGESTSGLGLVLACEFVAIHGGRVQVRSVVGGGSCFSFSIAQLA